MPTFKSSTECCTAGSNDLPCLILEGKPVQGDLQVLLLISQVASLEALPQGLLSHALGRGDDSLGTTEVAEATRPSTAESSSGNVAVRGLLIEDGDSRFFLRESTHAADGYQLGSLCVFTTGDGAGCVVTDL